MIDLLTTLVVLAAGGVPAALRWLRVAQREHYLAPWTTRFARRWHLLDRTNQALLAVAAIAALMAFVAGPFALLTAAVAVVAPVGLPIRGRTSPLNWTRRLRTVAAVTAAISVLAVVVGLLVGVGPAVAAVVVVAMPAIVDAALALLAPAERRAAARFVEQASTRLRAVDPTTVAITGSYGKTTTKVLVDHLLREQVAVVASPASFNNTAGLSRSVNEHLADDTAVFVAEMGTYGPGEIRSMCAWVQPDIGVMTAIGPVHLERMLTLDGIVEAKREILEGASAGVLNVDAHGLAKVADEVEADGLPVVRCSTTDEGADVHVRRLDDGLRVVVRGEVLATEVEIDADASNVACALGIALALEVDAAAVVDRLSSAPTAKNRRETVTAESGATIIDDTFNSNPDGAVAALAQLRRLASPDRKAIVVTPGMIELGELQTAENQRFAERAAEAATHLLLVGRTNLAALRTGAGRGRAEVLEFATRDEAVTWVRAHTARGDVVLYENDLPDHFP
ncbi:MAG: UDP-N-acetylmuramoyl-tripeptide--D-alanyl-D-alanine ligase [Actinomycetota bacterium]